MTIDSPGISLLRAHHISVPIMPTKTEAQPNSPAFYSHAERVIQDKVPNSAHPQQVAKTLANNGVKPEEMRWTGLDDHLAKAQGPVNKDDLLGLVRANNAQVKEVTYGDDAIDESKIQPRPDGTFRVWAESDRGWTDKIVSSRQEAETWLRARQSEGYTQTKYHKYQLPGGTNYREMLLTLPRKNHASNWTTRKNHEETEHSGVEHRDIVDIHGHVRATLPANEVADHLRRESKSSGSEQEYRSPHWSDPNVLAHIRMNDRAGPNGEKLLHVEEIQSDWAQSGRKKGFQDSPRAFVEWHQSDPLSARADLPNGGKIHAYKTVAGHFLTTVTGGREFDSLEQAKRAAEDDWRSKTIDPRLPDMPFKKIWHELALRRVLRHAAEHNYHGVSWTPGDEQASRYDLSKHISKIEYEPIKEPPGTYELAAYDMSGHKVLHEEEIPLDRVEELVGKDMAKKIEASEGQHTGGAYRGWRTLSGLDLKVGGEGMKGFYDKIVRDYLNKYGKKWGAKVGETQIDAGEPDKPWAVVDATDDGGGEEYQRFGSEAEATRWQDQHMDGGTQVIKLPSGKITVPHIPITDQMRHSVLHEGQALFSKRQPPTRLSALVHRLKTRFAKKKTPWHELSIAEMQRYPTKKLDRIAFGLARGDKISIPPDVLKIVHHDDLENVYYEMKHKGLTPQEYAQTFDLTKPVEISIRDGKKVLDDGHHRYVAAKIRGAQLPAVVDIHDNPIEHIYKNAIEKGLDVHPDAFRVFPHLSEFKVTKRTSTPIKMAKSFLPSDWHKRFHFAIRKAFKSNEVMDHLVDSPIVRSGPFDGGCLVCAKAIIYAAGGGELVRLTNPERDVKTEHYGAMIDGVIYDGNGAHRDGKTWANNLAKYENDPSLSQLNFGKGYDQHSEIPDDPVAAKKIGGILSSKIEPRERTKPPSRMSLKESAKRFAERYAPGTNPHLTFADNLRAQIAEMRALLKRGAAKREGDGESDKGKADQKKDDLLAKGHQTLAGAKERLEDYEVPVQHDESFKGERHTWLQHPEKIDLTQQEKEDVHDFFGGPVNMHDFFKASTLADGHRALVMMADHPDDGRGIFHSTPHEAMLDKAGWDGSPILMVEGQHPDHGIGVANRHSYVSRIFLHTPSGEIHCYNNYITLRRHGYRAGLDGRGMVHSQIEALHRLGVKKIHSQLEYNQSRSFEAPKRGIPRDQLDPAKDEHWEKIGYVGGKVWPLMGYGGDIPIRHLITIPPEIRRGMQGGDVRDLLDAPGGKEWWQQNPHTIYRGYMDTDPQSRTRQAHEKAWGELNMKKGIQPKEKQNDPTIPTSVSAAKPVAQPAVPAATGKGQPSRMAKARLRTQGTGAVDTGERAAGVAGSTGSVPADRRDLQGLVRQPRGSTVVRMAKAPRVPEGKHWTPDWNPGNPDAETIERRKNDPLWQYHRGLFARRDNISYIGGVPIPHSPIMVAQYDHHLDSHGGIQGPEYTVPNRRATLQPPACMEKYSAYYDADSGRAINDLSAAEKLAGGNGVGGLTLDFPYTITGRGLYFGNRQPHQAVFALRNLLHYATKGDPYRILAASVMGGNRHAIGPLVHLLQARDNPAGWWKGWTDLHRRMEREQGDLSPDVIARRLHNIAKATESESHDSHTHKMLADFASHQSGSHYPPAADESVPLNEQTPGKRDWTGWLVLADHMDEYGLHDYAWLIRNELMNVEPETAAKASGRRRMPIYPHWYSGDPLLTTGKRRKFSHAESAKVTPEFPFRPQGQFQNTPDFRSSGDGPRWRSRQPNGEPAKSILAAQAERSAIAKACAATGAPVGHSVYGDESLHRYVEATANVLRNQPGSPEAQEYLRATQNPNQINQGELDLAAHGLMKIVQKEHPWLAVYHDLVSAADKTNEPHPHELSVKLVGHPHEEKLKMIEPERMSRRGKPKRFMANEQEQAFHKAMSEEYATSRENNNQTASDEFNKSTTALKYADWLERNGRPATAEAIRLHHDAKTKDNDGPLVYTHETPYLRESPVTMYPQRYTHKSRMMVKILNQSGSGCFNFTSKLDHDHAKQLAIRLWLEGVRANTKFAGIRRLPVEEQPRSGRIPIPPELRRRKGPEIKILPNSRLPIDEDARHKQSLGIKLAGHPHEEKLKMAEPARMAKKETPKRFAFETEEHRFHRQMAYEYESSVKKGQVCDSISPLVYADWLEENGRPATAEAIRMHSNDSTRLNPGTFFHYATSDDWGKEPPNMTVYPSDKYKGKKILMCLHVPNLSGKGYFSFVSLLKPRHANGLVQGLAEEGVRPDTDFAKKAIGEGKPKRFARIAHNRIHPFLSGTRLAGVLNKWQKENPRDDAAPIIRHALTARHEQDGVDHLGHDVKKGDLDLLPMHVLFDYLQDDYHHPLNSMFQWQGGQSKGFVTLINKLALDRDYQKFVDFITFNNPYGFNYDVYRHHHGHNYTSLGEVGHVVPHDYENPYADVFRVTKKLQEKHPWITPQDVADSSFRTYTKSERQLMRRSDFANLYSRGFHAGIRRQTETPAKQEGNPERFSATSQSARRDQFLRTMKTKIAKRRAARL